MSAMKRLLVIMIVGLAVVAAACSSSSKPSTAGTSTTGKTSTTKAGGKKGVIGTGKAAEDAQVCGAVRQFQADGTKLTSDPSQFKTSAAELHSLATKLTTNAPAAVAADAQAYATAMNTAADKIAVATTAAGAQSALVPLIYNVAKDQGITGLGTWVKANC
jgi:hypothetical protein